MSDLTPNGLANTASSGGDITVTKWTGTADAPPARNPGPLRYHRHLADGTTAETFMERLSEKVASGLGTVAFVAISSAIIVVWIIINAVGVVRFDRYPFILLNLAFSAQAFYTGALVIIAQKAQTRTDKCNELAAAQHRDEIDAYQRAAIAKNTKLTEEIHANTAVLADIHEDIGAASRRLIKLGTQMDAYVTKLEDHFADLPAAPKGKRPSRAKAKQPDGPLTDQGAA